MWIPLYPSIGDATRRVCHYCPSALPKVVKGPSILKVRKCKANRDLMGFKRSGRDKVMIYELIGVAFTYIGSKSLSDALGVSPSCREFDSLAPLNVPEEVLSSLSSFLELEEASVINGGL